MALETNRLLLVACTIDLLQADGGDRAGFSRLIGAAVTEEWPPELYDDDARMWTIDRLESVPGFDEWAMWYVILREPRTVIGAAGYKGPPDESGVVEVGYGILPAFQRRGFASEATSALIARAFERPDVTAVAAETYPHLTASLGVMRKNNMEYVGPGSEDGVIRYAIRRPS
ncbi:MAG: GNAT family N-acetyltransferase [Gemmatimonadota bacterium]